MTLATHARLTNYGTGVPDPLTATCATHAVGAPLNNDTRAVGGVRPIQPGTPPVDCIICAGPYADLIGQRVLDTDGDIACVYAGPHPNGRGGMQRSYDMTAAGRAVLLWTNPTNVAPADEAPVPVKDARLVVVKRAQHEVPSNCRPTKAGMWELTLPARPSAYFTTKREATQVGLARLAILDWHASR